MQKKSTEGSKVDVNGLRRTGHQRRDGKGVRIAGVKTRAWTVESPLMELRWGEGETGGA